jgi:uncharacterized protein (DUF427 family)
MEIEVMSQKWSVVEPQRRVRTLFNGETVADSAHPILLRESGIQLVYYFPKADVRRDLLEDIGHTEKSGYKGTAHFFNVKVGDKVMENAAWTYPETKENRPDLHGYIAFDWHKMDSWFEEDLEVFGHPRDPFHRVDVYPSSRQVKVVIDGEMVAESTQAHFLFETGIKPRYYIPREDVKMERLSPTDTHTLCPYKGTASYYSVDMNGKTYKDTVWYYPDPLPGQPWIENLLAFWDDKDAAIQIFVDGEPVG